MVNKDVYN